MNATRFPLIDALKVIATQLIVLHHLAFYGPMSNVAFDLAPDFFTWLSHHARMAVQIFLVIGGFLAARSLTPLGVAQIEQPLIRIGQRYFRLVVPCVIALVIAIFCAALARQGMNHDSIPVAPTWAQLLAHLFLLQNILGYEGLSAGIWYVAIDFQLFSLTLLLLWSVQRFGGTDFVKKIMGPVCVIMLGIASLFFFNRDATWDVFALYFFGAYAIGIVAYWGSLPKRSWAGWVLLVVVLIALAVDFRQRIVVALCTGLLLAVASDRGWIQTWFASCSLEYLGKISYAVFLIHFPVCLLVNTLLVQIAPDSPGFNALGIAAAWVLSNLSGALFFENVEKRALLFKRRKFATAA